MNKFVPRDCVKIIQSMLDLIPEDEEELREALEWNKNDASYKAPEETIQWERTSQTLQEYITIPTEDWEFEILSIFSTIPVEEIRKQVKS